MGTELLLNAANIKLVQHSVITGKTHILTLEQLSVALQLSVAVVAEAFLINRALLKGEWEFFLQTAKYKKLVKGARVWRKTK